MKISDNTARILSNLRIEGNEVVITEKLDRKEYALVNEVLNALGGTWLRKAKAHVFEPEAQVAELVDAVITSGEIQTMKDHRKQLGFFPTPEAVGRLMIEQADLKPGLSVLEPSAGDGALVRLILLAGVTDITVCERDPARRQGLVCLGGLRVLEHDDFLSMPAKEVFDRVIMNPPFVRSGQGDHLDHVQHAFRMLKKGGILVTVLPDSVIWREDNRHKDFRAWLKKHPWGPVDPGALAFRPSGTSVRTQILFIEKV